jgi:transposase
LGLWPRQVQYLNDDRLGRCLDQLFDATTPDLVVAVVRQVIQEFRLSLDELHNDSTSVTFYGTYPGALQEGRLRGRPTHAITWGHNKDHRPDLKQLLYILTVSEDGGVPVYFSSASGNVVDDQTHQQTWQLLRQLVGHSDFLYVADCKLATTENMNYIAQQDGRFVSILPRSRKEDKTFRKRLRDTAAPVVWRHVYALTDKNGQLRDRLRVCTEEAISKEGYRLFWFHSLHKAELEATARSSRTQRALAELAQLRQRLQGPRTRFREQAKVEEAVQAILQQFEVEPWVTVHIHEQEQTSYRQAHRGRPNEQTQYVKRVKTRYTLVWEIAPARLAQEQLTDGIFPLITNDKKMDPEELLRTYKRQPLIEKRFSQFKTDFEVAPVYLENVSRIQALLAVYFFVLLVQTLLERELRQAMVRHDLAWLPMYPEARECRRPTARRLFDLFEPVQRHMLTLPNGHVDNFVTELSPVQRQIAELFGIASKTYAI